MNKYRLHKLFNIAKSLPQRHGLAERPNEINRQKDETDGVNNQQNTHQFVDISITCQNLNRNRQHIEEVKGEEYRQPMTVNRDRTRD